MQGEMKLGNKKTLANLGRKSAMSLALLGILKTVRGRWVRKDTLNFVFTPR